MIGLPGTPLARSPLAYVRWTRDIVYHDGPMLSEFRNQANEPLLFAWCDADEELNRWLAFRVRERNLIAFLRREADLRSLVEAPADGFVYVVDIDDAARHVGCSVVASGDLPADYMPRPGSQLPPTAPTAGRSSYVALIDGAWDTPEVAEFPVKFQQAYVAMYVYAHAADGNARPVIRNYPWRGGFSAMHFYNGLRAEIPAAARPNLVAFVYASPGYVSWELDRGTVRALQDAIESYAGDRETIVGIAEASLAFVRDNGLNNREAAAGSAEDTQLGTYFTALAEALGSVDPARVRAAHGDNNFACLKIVISIYRRIRFLYELRERRMVKF